MSHLLSLQESVSKWLESLKLSQYQRLFEKEGYSTVPDVESLKGLTEKDLKKIGITRRGSSKFLCIHI